MVTKIIKADVDPTEVDAVVREARLPPGSICLIVGDPQLDSRYQGLTIARAQVQYAANLYGLEAFLHTPWDCGVLIGNYWALRQRQFPAYFAFLMGHEFGHASTALRDSNLTVCEEFLTRAIRKVAAEREWRWDELPHEICYDQFGLAVAERIHGRKTIEAEFSVIIDGGLQADAVRLDKVLSLSPRQTLDGLREELAAFCYPYRAKLLKIWREHTSQNKRRGDNYASAFEELIQTS